MVRTLHPQAVGQVRVGRTIVSDEVLRAVVVFVVLYLVWWGAASLLLVLLGLDLVSAVTGTLACLANCGPGLNRLGPMANYEHLPALSKVVLVVTMWVGRLEVVTVLALARPDVLRKVRWR
jgi:trk system potassium uptake protein TrkH